MPPELTAGTTSSAKTNKPSSSTLFGSHGCIAQQHRIIGSGKSKRAKKKNIIALAPLARTTFTFNPLRKTTTQSSWFFGRLRLTYRELARRGEQTFTSPTRRHRHRHGALSTFGNILSDIFKKRKVWEDDKYMKRYIYLSRNT